MEAKIYNQSGKEADKIKLSEKIFGVKWNADLVHQVVQSMLSDARVIYAHTKDRSEVRGGGRKPWKQKGLGRARHGSTRSPIWVGGGVALGPNGKKNYARKVNKKMKAKALFAILSRKFAEGQILFVENLAFAKPSTKEALSTLKNFSKIESAKDIFSKKKNSAIVAFEKKNVIAEKSFSNIGNVETDELRNINPVDLLNYKYLVIENPVESLKILEKKLTSGK